MLVLTTWMLFILYVSFWVHANSVSYRIVNLCQLFPPKVLFQNKCATVTVCQQCRHCLFTKTLSSLNGNGHYATAWWPMYKYRRKGWAYNKVQQFITTSEKTRRMWFTLSTCGLYTGAVYSLKDTAQLVVHTCGWKLRTHTLPELTTCRIAFILVPNRCFSYSPYSTNCPSAMSASNSCFEMKWYSRPSTSPSPIGRLVSTRFISDTHLAVLTIVAQQANTSSSSRCSYTNKNIIKVT